MIQKNGQIGVIGNRCNKLRTNVEPNKIFILMNERTSLISLHL